MTSPKSPRRPPAPPTAKAPVKAAATRPAPTKATTKAPAKAPSQAAIEVPAKAAPKAPAKAPAKAVTNASVKAAAKAPVKAPAKATAAPAKAPAKAARAASPTLPARIDTTRTTARTRPAVARPLAERSPAGPGATRRFPPPPSSPQPPPPPPEEVQTSRGVPTWARIAGGVAFAVFFALGRSLLTGGGDDADRDDKGKITAEGNAAATQLRVGDCLKDLSGYADGEQVEDVGVIPCAQVHKGEVFATFDLTGGSFPGDTVVSERAEAGCVARFATFVGVPFEDSTLELSFLNPVSDSWSRDKGVTCVVTADRLVGTAKGFRK